MTSPAARSEIRIGARDLGGVLDRDVVAFAPLEPLEVACGMMFGRRRGAGSGAEVDSRGSGYQAILDGLLLQALERPPCRVAFSGGRDSSAILAAATGVARAQGLDDPVPLTLRFSAFPRTHESEWQDLVVAHLGLREREIVEVGSELEAVGPIAGPLLRRHGLYWPPNAQTMAMLFRSARGGSLVTGNGGDEVFSPWNLRVPLGQVLRARPRRRALKHAAFGLLPRRVRVPLWARRTLGLPWLRPAARRRVLRLYVGKLRSRPGHEWRAALQALVDSRYLETTLGAFEAFARDDDVRLVQPFYDPRFLGALADIAPPIGFPDRAAAMRILFGDLLPVRSVERTTKASFTEAFFGPACRAFAERWDGTGLDPRLIDLDALRAEWSKPRPDFRAMTPLQAAWLASGA